MENDNFYLVFGAGLWCSIGYLIFKYLFMYDFTLNDLWIVPTIILGWPGAILLLAAMKAYCQAKRWEDLARQRAKIVDFQAARNNRETSS